MEPIQVIGLFENRSQLEQARAALLRSHLATDTTIQVVPAYRSQEFHPANESLKQLWNQVKEALQTELEDVIGTYAEGVRRGGWLLVATVLPQLADRVRRIMAENGAVDMQRRLADWKAAGWTGFKVGPLPVMQEIDANRPICLDESATLHAKSTMQDDQNLPIRLFDESTGWEIGRISESELKVLQDALEEEGPDDKDYWINPDTIDMLACRPGATPHLIALLRRAVGDNLDGLDIAFQRQGEEIQSLRQTPRMQKGR
jgi:hypothetical protein